MPCCYHVNGMEEYSSGRSSFTPKDWREPSKTIDRGRLMGGRRRKTSNDDLRVLLTFDQESRGHDYRIGWYTYRYTYYQQTINQSTAQRDLYS